MKNFNCYIVITAVINFCKSFSITNNFLVNFSGIITNIFQHKKVLVYSIGSQSTV